MRYSATKLTKPIIIIGAPRSGTTFLKELLTFHDELWHLPEESHSILEGLLHPKNFETFSNRPDQGFKLSENQIEEIHIRFWEAAINVNIVPGAVSLLDGVRHNRFARKALLTGLGKLSKLYKHKAGNLHFIEKTPKNTVRIPVINQIFPDAKYIYIKRDPIKNILSILNGWNHETGFIYRTLKGKPRFATYSTPFQTINDFQPSNTSKGSYWRFLLPPEWKKQKFRDILDIAIYQYFKSNELAENDLKDYIDPTNVYTIDHQKLTDNTEEVVQELLTFTGLSTREYRFLSLKKMPRINQSKNTDQDLAGQDEIEKRLSEKFSL